MKVLIVDDNALRALLIREYLHMYGAETKQCASVESGLNCLRSADFDYVFFDIDWEPDAIKSLLRNAKLLNASAIFVLTSYNDDKRCCYRQLGFDSLFEVSGIQPYLSQLFSQSFKANQFA